MNLKVAQKTNEFCLRGMGSNENKAKRQTKGMDSDKRRYSVSERGRDGSFHLHFSLSPLYRETQKISAIKRLERDLSLFLSLFLCVCICVICTKREGLLRLHIYIWWCFWKENIDANYHLHLHLLPIIKQIKAKPIIYYTLFTTITATSFFPPSLTI